MSVTLERLRKAGGTMAVNIVDGHNLKTVEVGTWRKVRNGPQKVTLSSWVDGSTYSVNVYVPAHSDLIADLQSEGIKIPLSKLTRGDDYIGKGRGNAGLTMQKYSAKAPKAKGTTAQSIGASDLKAGFKL